jgi:hypothetical protein
MKRMVSAALLLTAMSGALAAGEWRLVTPPWSDFDASAPGLSRYKMLDDEPLSLWKQESAFDSASDCQAARSNMLGNLQRNFDASYAASREYAKTKDVQTLELANLSMMSEVAHASVMAYTAARCVRSDDPQLSALPQPAR